MKEYTYRVNYIANDGSHCNFRFKSSHVIVGSGRISLMSNPLFGEVLTRASKIARKDGSAMNRHGGWKRIVGILNEDTGLYQPYNI